MSSKRNHELEGAFLVIPHHMAQKKTHTFEGQGPEPCVVHKQRHGLTHDECIFVSGPHKNDKVYDRYGVARLLAASPTTPEG